MGERPIQKLLQVASERGLSYTETAEALGVSKQVLTNWKRRGIPPKDHKRVARFCGITVDELVGVDRRPAHRVADEERTRVHGRLATPEEVDFGIEWGKLEEPERSLVQTQVLLMVAEQKRRKRGRDKPTKSPDDNSLQ